MKLTLVEKMAIKQALAEGKDYKEIAQITGRHLRTVTKYIDEELDGLVDTIAAVQSTKGEDSLLELIPENVVQNTVRELRLSGFKDEEHALEIIKRVILKSKENNIDPPQDEASLKRACIRSINAKDVTITKTDGGKGGVAIFTSAASQRGDESKKKPGRIKGGRAKGAIYQPKDGKFV